MRKKDKALILIVPIVILILIYFFKFERRDDKNGDSIALNQKQIEQILTQKRIESSTRFRVLGEIVEEEPEWIIELSEDEFEKFCMLTYAEDGNEEEDFQVAIAATIINRIQSDSFFPDNFYGVMSQKNAFSTVKAGEVCINSGALTFDMVPEKTKNAVERALKGEDPTEEILKQEARKLGLDEEFYASGGALYFYNPKYSCSEALESRSVIKVKDNYGAHIFYKVWG